MHLIGVARLAGGGGENGGRLDLPMLAGEMPIFYKMQSNKN